MQSRSRRHTTVPMQCCSPQSKSTRGAGTVRAATAGAKGCPVTVGCPCSCDRPACSQMIGHSRRSWGSWWTSLSGLRPRRSQRRSWQPGTPELLFGGIVMEGEFFPYFPSFCPHKGRVSPGFFALKDDSFQAAGPAFRGVVGFGRCTSHVLDREWDIAGGPACLTAEGTHCCQHVWRRCGLVLCRAQPCPALAHCIGPC